METCQEKVSQASRAFLLSGVLPRPQDVTVTEEWKEPNLPSLDPPLKGAWMEIREHGGDKWYPAYVAATNHQRVNGGVVAEYTVRIVLFRKELLEAIDNSPGYVAFRKELGVE
jgi:hypothetical protein